MTILGVWHCNLGVYLVAIWVCSMTEVGNSVECGGDVGIYSWVITF